MPQMSPIMWSVFPVVMILMVLVGVVLLHDVELIGGEEKGGVFMKEKKQW